MKDKGDLEDIIDLEDLIFETEQKILNKEYYDDRVIKYKGKNIGVRIKPISQADFVNLTKNRKVMQSAEINTLFIKECVINKKNNEHFTVEQINKLFTGGLANLVALECAKVSGIDINPAQFEQLKKF